VVFFHAGRNRTLAKARELFEQQKQLVKLSPYERRVRRMPSTDEMLAALPKYRYAILKAGSAIPATIIPDSGPERAAELAFRAKAEYQATLTVVALQRYRLEKGSYPGTLAELKSAGYLDVLPADPYSDGPLGYKIVGDGFTLYTVGPDFHDDGGEPARDSDGKPRMWADQGDTVFWPAP
jgi:hypothetical protein